MDHLQFDSVSNKIGSLSFCDFVECFPQKYAMYFKNQMAKQFKVGLLMKVLKTLIHLDLRM